MTDEDLAAIRARYDEPPNAARWSEIIGRDRQTYLEYYDDAPDIVARLILEVERLRAIEPHTVMRNIDALQLEERLRTVEAATKRRDEQLRDIEAKMQRIATENAAMHEIVEKVASLEARQSEVWNELGLFHDSMNVLYIREQARALLGKQEA